MQRNNQLVRATLFLALVGSLISCSDPLENVLAPPDNALGSSGLQTFQIQPQSIVSLSGQLSFSAWQTRAEGFGYVGTFSAPVDGKVAPLTEGNVTSSITGPVEVTEFAGDAASSPRITTPSFASPSGNDLLNVLRASGPGRALRVNLGGPTRTETMPDGRELRVEFSPPNSDGSTQTVAFYVDDKLKALNYFTYARQSSRSIATAMDVVHFREEGGVAGITNYDLTEVDADPLAINEEILGVAAGVQTLAGDCETQIDPEPECEDTGGGGDGPCTSEWLQFLSAGAALVAAGIAFDAAVASCAGTLVTCPTVAAAAAAVSSAGLAVAAADRNLRECRMANSDRRSGGGGGGGRNCETYIIEVSNDGGVTWEEIGRVTNCS